MRNADDIKRIFDEAVVETNPSKDEKILENITAAYKQTNKAQPEKGELNILRTIMKSPITKLAVAAGVIIAAVIGISLFDKVGTSVTFGEVLDNLAHVQTLHAIWSKDGKKAEIWAKRPNMVRVEYDDGTYNISNEATMWTVDPVNNKATQEASWYFKNAQRQGLDVLDSLVRMEYTDLSGFFSEGPIGQISQNGKTFDVYQMEINQYGGKIKFEALVYSETHLLHLMKLESFGAQGQNQVLELTILEYDQDISDEQFTFKPSEGMQVIVNEDEDVRKSTERAGGSTLSGRIVWASSGKPVGGAELTFWGRTQTDGNFVRVPTNSDGYWLVKGMPAGQVDISVRSWELDWPAMPQFERDSGSPGHPSIVVDGNSEYKGLDFKVYKPEDLFANITISVKDEDGKPVEGASGHLEYCDGSGMGQHIYAETEIKRRQSTESDGIFDAGDIWPTQKPVTISIGTQGEHRAVYATGGSLTLSQTEPFIIEPKASYHFDVILYFVRKMKVQVVNTKSEPLEGVCVSVQDRKGGFPIFPLPWLEEKVFTDSEGIVEVGRMAPSEDVVIVLKRLEGDPNNPDKHIAACCVEAKGPQDRDEYVTLKCVFDEKPIYIKGSIDSALQKDKRRIDIMVSGEAGELTIPFMIAASDESGDFVFSGVPEGKIRVVCTYITGRERKIIERAIITEAGCTYTLKITDKGIEVINQEPNP